MNDLVGNIFYFGAPKDGFKVYPDLGAASNIFSGYYSNTETDWNLIAIKTNEITRYTYVKYGLLTSVVDGRTGSCFGISIDVINHYFTDLKVLQTQIFEGVWGAILEHKVLLDIQEPSRKVAFKSYDLYDVSQYLDEMSKRIREVIADKKYANYIKPSYDIPTASDTIYGLHPDSSPLAINEYFRTSGAIKLSPKLPIEKKSFSEKQEEHRIHLQEEVDRLTNQLKQKDVEKSELLRQKEDEIKKLNQKLERLEGLAKQILNEFPSIPINEPSNFYVNPVAREHTYQPYTPKAPTTYTGDSQPPYTWKLDGARGKILKIVVGAIILLVVLYVIINIPRYLSEDEKPAFNNNVNANQLPAQPKPTPVPTTALTVTQDKGKIKGFLKGSAFLESNAGALVSNEEDFKEILTTYLLKSTEVREFYNGDKNVLWNNIVALNPNSTKKITNYIKGKGQFRIEASPEQEDMLKDLVIYTK